MDRTNYNQDAPQGWEQYSRLLQSLPQAPLPPGYEQRMAGRLSAIGKSTFRPVFAWEWAAGMGLAAFAALVVFTLNAILGPAFPTEAENAAAVTVKANAKRRQAVRRQAVRRQAIPDPLATGSYVDSMPPASLDQLYPNATTGAHPLTPEELQQYNAEPGMPGMLK